MTWAEYSAARQMLVEEHIGRGLRQAQAAEDAVVARTKRGLTEKDRGKDKVHGTR